MAKRKNASIVVSRLELHEEGIAPRILMIRGNRVLLDRDLAALYDVKAIALKQQVRRNPKRFPKDFVFQLRHLEVASLVSQNVIPSLSALGGSMPLAFTEQGIAMLSSVLNSDRAIEVNLAIIRTFVKMRMLLAGNEELLQRLQEMAWKQGEHTDQIQHIFDTLQQLVDPPVPDAPRRQIGFPAGA